MTGGAKGIGRAIALGFIKEGARVALFDVHEIILKNTLLDVKKISEESDYAIADVSDLHDVAGGVKTVMDKFGRIDILVTCLGT